jgi:lipooligosaccharide transport system permease protein
VGGQQGHLTAVCILAMIWLLDIAREPLSLLAAPVAFFIALVFAAMALIVNAVARSYDLLSNYFTVVVMPLCSFRCLLSAHTAAGLAARTLPSGFR